MRRQQAHANRRDLRVSCLTQQELQQWRWVCEAQPFGLGHGLSPTGRFSQVCVNCRSRDPRRRPGNAMMFLSESDCLGGHRMNGAARRDVSRHIIWPRLDALRAASRVLKDYDSHQTGRSSQPPDHREPRLRPALAERDVLQVGPDLVPRRPDLLDGPAVRKRFPNLPLDTRLGPWVPGSSSLKQSRKSRPPGRVTWASPAT